MKFARLLIIILTIVALSSCTQRSSPQPGSTFRGEVKSGTDIEGTIVFSVSDNGTEITSMQVDALGCMLLSRGAQITDGEFQVDVGGGTIKGSFTSPTQARGTVEIEAGSMCNPGQEPVVLKWQAQVP